MHKFSTLCTSLAAAAFISSLSGCAGSPVSTYGSIGPRVADDKVKAEKLLALLAAPAIQANASPASYSEKSWLPVRKVVRSERDIENAKTNNIQVEVNQRFANLNEVVGVISSLTGLPVFVSPDVISGSIQQAQPAAAPSSMPTMMPAGIPNLPPLPGGSSGYGASLGSAGGLATLPSTPSGPISPASAFSTNYSGSLTGLLNLVSAYYGISWKSEEAGLRFYKMESKTFRIIALPGDMRLSSSIESSAGGGGGGGASGGSPSQSGSSTSSTGVAVSGLSVWTSMESAIKLMLSPGGKVFSSPATGTITVTDAPSIIAEVAEFVNGQNKSMGRQVSVNVRVLTVDVNEGDDYGINWDSVYKNLSAIGNPYSVALKTAFPMTSGGGNLVLSAPSTSSSRWAGSSAMIAALSTQGRVSELTSSTLVTLNNQPSPVNVGRRVSYLASSSTTQTPNVGATTALTPGSVQTGFSMTLLPHIIDGRELLLQYSLDLSSLLRLSTITSGTASIQAPDISTSNFIQRVRMQSGETLVVAGFDQDNLSAVANGIGAAENTVLGSRNGTKKRSMLVVLIQPNISAQ